jgi:RimJ/RimL family protein N-acetyltransferase
VFTERLSLRRWTSADREPFAAMNGDPAVMRFFPAPLTRAESDAFADRIETGFEANGFGLWAVERQSHPGLIGYVGLSRPTFAAHFTPCVEIGWRLTPSAWGQGFATEAARRVLELGFDEYGLSEIVSFTTTRNVPSRAVMERIGMQHDPAEDFDHPVLPEGHPLRRHVLYRLRRAA